MTPPQTDLPRAALQEVRKYVTRAQKNWQLLVFIVLDAPGEQQEGKPRRHDSIMDMQVLMQTCE